MRDVPLRNQADPAALTFCGGTDCGDDFEHLAEDSNRWMAANNVNAIDRYRKGDVCIVVNVLFGVSSQQSQFIFSSIPPRASWANVAKNKAMVTGAVATATDDAAAGIKSGDWLSWGQRIDFEAGSAGSEGNQGEVFLGVTQLIQGPKDVIPSFVGVASPKERDDFRRQILTAAGHSVIPTRLVFREGKFDVDGRAFRGDGASVPAMVKGGPEIAHSIEYDARKVGWKCPSKSDLMQFMESISILIDDVGPWLFIREGENLPFQVVDVMVCAGHGSFSALEMVNHG